MINGVTINIDRTRECVHCLPYITNYLVDELFYLKGLNKKSIRWIKGKYHHIMRKSMHWQMVW